MSATSTPVGLGDLSLPVGPLYPHHPPQERVYLLGDSANYYSGTSSRPASHDDQDVNTNLQDHKIRTLDILISRMAGLTMDDRLWWNLLAEYLRMPYDQAYQNSGIPNHEKEDTSRDDIVVHNFFPTHPEGLSSASSSSSTHNKMNLRFANRQKTLKGRYLYTDDEVRTLFDLAWQIVLEYMRRTRQQQPDRFTEDAESFTTSLERRVTRNRSYNRTKFHVKSYLSTFLQYTIIAVRNILNGIPAGGVSLLGRVFLDRNEERFRLEAELRKGTISVMPLILADRNAPQKPAVPIPIMRSGKKSDKKNDKKNDKRHGNTSMAISQYYPILESGVEQQPWDHRHKLFHQEQTFHLQHNSEKISAKPIRDHYGEDVDLTLRLQSSSYSPLYRQQAHQPFPHRKNLPHLDSRDDQDFSTI